MKKPFESVWLFRQHQNIGIILNKSHAYNALGRVNRVENAINSAVPSTIGMGGSYVNEYLYDSFNRLSEAKGTFGGTQTYQVAMEYNALRLRSAQALRHRSVPGCQLGKWFNLSNQKHQTVAGGFSNNFAYNNAYTYDANKPHQLLGLSNAAVGSGQPLEVGFAWNASGSMRAIASKPTSNATMDTTEHFNFAQCKHFGFAQCKRFVYNEEQWMMGHPPQADTQTDQYTHFVYDHTSTLLSASLGERILKGSINTASLSTNGQSPALSLTMDPYTLYLNPFYVAVQRNQMDQVSKHYYYNGQRFATKMGFYLHGSNPPVGPIGENAIAKNLGFTLEGLGFEESISWSMQTKNPPDTNLAHYPRLMYYYHASTSLSGGPDYLGHVEYITDLDGLPYQHFYYTAWGETLIEEKATRPGMNFDSPYRFNGKELDEETGLYYYGARYYNPTVSVWLGVDPMASERSWLTPYNFVQNNPITRIDPDGMLDDEWNYNTITGEMTKVSDLGGSEFQFVNFVTPHENGGMVEQGKAVIDGANAFAGPVSGGFGASGTDYWSSIPENYNTRSTDYSTGGRYIYSISDLKMRKQIFSDSKLSQYRGIVSGLEESGNAQPLSKSGFNRQYTAKYHTNKSFWHAIEAGYFGPADASSIALDGLTIAKSVTRSARNFKFSQSIITSCSNVSSPRSSWNQFLHETKGTYKGSDWIKKASDDYKIWKQNK